MAIKSEGATNGEVDKTGDGLAPPAVEVVVVGFVARLAPPPAAVGFVARSLPSLDDRIDFSISPSTWDSLVAWWSVFLVVPVEEVESSDDSPLSGLCPAISAIAGREEETGGKKKGKMEVTLDVDKQDGVKGAAQAFRVPPGRELGESRACSFGDSDMTVCLT